MGYRARASGAGRGSSVSAVKTGGSALVADLTPGMFDAATDALTGATETYRAAGNAHAKAKEGLEQAQACLLRDGVEGKNDKERGAHMREALSEAYAEEHAKALELNDARAVLEVAQIRFDTLRYKLRLLERGTL